MVIKTGEIHKQEQISPEALQGLQDAITEVLAPTLPLVGVVLEQPKVTITGVDFYATIVDVSDEEDETARKTFYDKLKELKVSKELKENGYELDDLEVQDASGTTFSMRASFIKTT